MLSLGVLFWLLVFAALVAFWWQSDQIKQLALVAVAQYCKRQDLQLLDQTMVLQGVWPSRNSLGSLVLRRTYRFEFTTTGSERYQGTVILHGKKLTTLDIPAHILPDEQHRLH